MLYLLPTLCHLCQLPSATNLALCDDCIAILPWKQRFCIKCAATLPEHINDNICGHCLTHPWAFDYCFAAFDYESYIRKMVAGLKFHEQLINAYLLGHLLSRQIPIWYQENPLPEVILPVPLHPSRTRKRGFNQALEICKAIHKMIKIPVDYRICKRVKKTKPQTTLHKHERKSNLVEAFSINQKKYNHVAIVDDVFTTGDTVNTLAKTLKNAGVQQIDVWCVARAKLN